MTTKANMEFINYTIKWIEGEILEAIITSVFGAIIVICGLLFWKFGTTLNAKSLIIPLIIIGLIPLVNGVFGALNNKSRISTYKIHWKQNKEEFVKAEHKRVKSFDDIFKYTYPLAIVLTIGGAILFFLVNSSNWKAISLAMITLGLMTYYIDHFAAERAEIYLKQIEQELQKQ